MRLSIEVLYRSGDATAFYSTRVHRGSMLDPLAAVLTVLGIALAAAKSRDFRFALPTLWFFGGLLGSALTLDTPSVQRLAGAWPAVVLFPALLLERIARAAEGARHPFVRRAPAIAAAGALAFVALNDIHEYFVHYRSLAPFGDATAQARYAAALGTEYVAYQLGVGGGAEPDVFFGYGSTRFLAKGVTGRDVTTASAILPVCDASDRGVAFLVYGWNAGYLPLLRLFYPGGLEETIRSSDCAPCFTSYKVQARTLRGLRTARASYRDSAGHVIRRDEPSVGTARSGEAGDGVWTAPSGLSYPMTASWEGAFVAPRYGSYSFALASTGKAELWVDGGRVAESGAAGTRANRILAAGLHEIRLAGFLDGPEPAIIVTCGFASETGRPIPPRLLFRGPTGGLLGETWRGEGGGPPAARRVDPVIGFREARDDPDFGAGPFVARWRGKLRADVAGSYRFELRSSGEATLRIDGQSVSDAVTLGAGLHDVEIRYAPPAGRARLELYWTPPSGERTIVPPTVLVPERRSWSPDELEAESR